MKDSFSDAKQLFLTFDGNHFMMEREGVYETYKAYNIPKETEREWLTELRDEHRIAFEQAADVVTLVRHFEAYGNVIGALGDKNALRYMLGYLKQRIERLDTVTAYQLVSAIGNAAYGFDQIAYFRFTLKRRSAHRWKWIWMTNNYLTRESFYSSLTGAEFWTAMSHTTERKMARKLLPVLEALWMNPFSTDEAWRTDPHAQFCTEKSVRENMQRMINEYSNLLVSNFRRIFSNQ